MNDVEFLRALWGDPPPAGSLIQVWELGTRRSTYLPALHGTLFAGQPDAFTGVGLAGRNLGPRNRAKADQVVAIAGLWLDIDIDGGPEQKTGACPNRIVAEHLAWAHATPTIVVNSGYGVHAWWLFDTGPWIFGTIAERAEAALLAQRWQELYRQTARERGSWTIDHTHDLARVMRLPGSVNAKDPARPVPVVAYDRPELPRHAPHDLAALCADVTLSAPAPAARPDGRAVELAGDTSLFAAKLDALRHNSPEFSAAWDHLTHPEWAAMGSAASHWDLCLCSLASRAMTDPELARLIHEHRLQWGYDLAKARRATYLKKTIARARSRETQSAALDALARRDAAAGRTVSTKSEPR